MPDYGHDLEFGTFITPQNQRPHDVVALAQLTERMLEAVRKDYWKADPRTVRELVQTWHELCMALGIDTTSPLSWDELDDRSVTPSAFTIESVPEWLARRAAAIVASGVTNGFPSRSPPLR